MLCGLFGGLGLLLRFDPFRGTGNVIKAWGDNATTSELIMAYVHQVGFVLNGKAFIETLSAFGTKKATVIIGQQYFMSKSQIYQLEDNIPQLFKTLADSKHRVTTKILPFLQSYSRKFAL